MAYNPSSLCAPLLAQPTVPYPSVGFVTPQMYASPGQNISNGTTDATAAIQLAATTAGSIGASLYIPGTENFYLVSGTIGIPTHVTVYGDGPASYIKCSNLSVSIFAASTASNIVFRDIKIGYSTGSSSTASVGGISFSAVSNSTIERVELDHMIWSGTYISGASFNNVLDDIYVHDTQGLGGDTNDVAFTDNASYNTVQGSRLFGGALSAAAVLIQDRTGGFAAPIGNQVLYNNIDVHYSYGVLAGYCPTPTNLFTKVIGNTIQNITGTGNAGSSGMGVYSASAGGLIIAFNVLKNCCASTTDSTNFPAAISVTSQPAFTTAMAILITGNEIDTAHYACIGASDLPVNITDNPILNCTDITAVGNGIKCVDLMPGSVISNNTAKMATTAMQQAILVQTSARAIVDLSMEGNVAISGTNGAAFDIVGTAGFGISGTFSGNTGSSRGAAGQGARFQYVSGPISSNKFTGTNVALSLDHVTNVRGSTNIMRSAGKTLITSGVNSNSFFDQSNDFDYETSSGFINNAVAGVNVEIRCTAPPGSGTYQIGDRFVNRVSTIGQPVGWQITTAGTPGTATAEANL